MSALTGDYAIGAALLWAYLRDLFATTEREIFTRDAIIALLQSIQADPEMFSPGIVSEIADLSIEEETLIVRQVAIPVGSVVDVAEPIHELVGAA